MYDDAKRYTGRKLASPANNVVGRIVVEVALVKRRRIERVEELRQLPDANLDRAWTFRLHRHAATPAPGAENNPDTRGILSLTRRIQPMCPAGPLMQLNAAKQASTAEYQQQHETT